MIDVERSKDAPESLATKQRWDAMDVRRALAHDFLEKCYLCERPVTLGETEVEHRIPRALWNGGEFDWNNLFPSCRYCNMRRPAYHPDGLVSPGEGVEVRVSQRARVGDDGVSVACAFSARRLGDLQALRTAEELSHIHSIETATTGRAAAAAKELLDEIHDHYYYAVYPREMRVLRGRVRNERRPKDETELQQLLSRRAPFTMLMRSMVHPSLADLFD